jgi:hypothetical protein
MIDKRVSYQGGGRDASQPDFSPPSAGSSSDDERYQAAQAALKAEADRRQKAEQAARDREQAAIQQYTRPEPEDARGVDLHQGPTVKEVLDKVAADKREQEPIKSLEEAIDRVDKEREEAALKNKLINEPRERLMGLEGKTGIKDISLDTGEGFGTVDRSKVSQFSEYGRNRMIEALQPRGFFDTGLGKVIKNVGLGIVAPQLLAATPFAKPYSMYRTANTFSNVADAFGWNKPKDVMQTLTSDLITPTGLKTIDTTPMEGEGKEQYKKEFTKTAPKNVIEENIQKFSSEQLNVLRKRYAELQEVIKSGMLGERKLNMDELSHLGQISKQIESFLVDPEKMIAARGGLAGIHG